MPEETVTLTLDDRGRLQAIYDDSLFPLLELGDAVITRASRVEPAEGGGWCADMEPSSGPLLGPFPLHSEAIRAEVEWLRENRNL